MSILVSVVMPVYNGERFVGQAIESVLAQTYAQWELIVVDDGSTDGTAVVVADFSDPRIRRIYQENQGLAAARNAGIRLADGKYLCFLDADDEWYPGFLSSCVEAMGQNRDPRIVGVYTSHVHIDETGKVLPQPGSDVVPPEQLPAKLVAGNFFPPCVVMVRADVLRDVGLFDEKLPGQGTEDKDLWFRVTRKYTLLGIPEPLVRYRVYPGSMSTNAAEMHTSRMAVLQKHFGPDDGDPTGWSPDKRIAYSTGYVGSAFDHIAQGSIDEGWGFLLRGARIRSDLLTSEQMYYEMACLWQPRGYRGVAGGLDIRTVGEQILCTLESHIEAHGQVLGVLYKPAASTASLAFAALADQAGDWRLARRYMWQAFRTYPGRVVSKSSIRRALKLLAGKRIWAALRGSRGP